MPPRCTSTPPVARPAMSSSRWVSDLGMSEGVPIPVRPSAESEPAAAYGLSTPRTWATVPSCPSRPSTWVRTAGVLSGSAACTTTLIVSPDSVGKSRASSCCAVLESEPGAL